MPFCNISSVKENTEVEEPAITRARLLSNLASGRATEIRERAGISQADIARSIGASRTAIASWEQGIRRPRGELAARYARLLTALDELLERNTSGAL